jgi:hypothetical protein
MMVLRCRCTLFVQNIFFNFCELVFHHGRLVRQFVHWVTRLSLPGDVGFPPKLILVQRENLRSVEISAFCGSNALHFASACEVQRWQQSHCVRTILRVHTISLPLWCELIQCCSCFKEATIQLQHITMKRSMFMKDNIHDITIRSVQFKTVYMVGRLT